MPTSVAKYVTQTLVDYGVRHVFMLTGGGAMFLNDALGHDSRITPIFNHHEQACAMAAEAYARISGHIGVVNVTTGPGGINAMNGVFGAWTDSVPMLILSGQVKRETCLASYDLPHLRQLGDQEVDIIAMARPITKYAEIVCDPADIAYYLEKAIHLATHGRPGPCWLDIPIDVQACQVDPSNLRHYQPEEEPEAFPADAVEAHCRYILDKLVASKRPVIMAGTGIRAGNALAEFESVIRRLGIPIVTAWTHDLVASDDPLFCGRPGTIGTRGGNFTVQNADLLIVLGSRLNIRQTSYNWSSFAKNAFKIQVDIDAAELAKPTIQSDHGIHYDVKPLLARLAEMIPASSHDPARYREWLAWCRSRVEAYPAVLPKHCEWRGKINPYHFMEQLFELLDETDIVACANATATIVPFQVARLKAGQRLFSNSGSASMGYDLPAAIGAYFGAVYARGAQRRVICLAGDGSIQLNIQELQTIVNYRLPVKIFVLNNGGYLSIRTSQSNFFGRLTGAGPESGVSLPDYVRIGEAFGIPSIRLDQPNFSEALHTALDTEGPMLCEIILDETQQFEPRPSSRQLEDGRIVTPPLEDMYPFLDRDELAKNLLDLD